MPTALMKKVAKEQERMKQVYLAEGFGGRLKTKGGQVVPLKDRLTHFQMEKRAEKIVARRTAHEQLRSEQRQFMLGVAKAFNSHFNRGFFGRFKHLLFGK